MDFLIHPLLMIRAGFRDMPHVGKHPGLPLLWLLLGIAFLFGLREGSLLAVAVHLLAVSALMVPILSVGAYSRATLSDSLTRRDEVRKLLDAWVHMLDPQPRGPVRIGMKWLPKGASGELYVWRDTPDYKPNVPAWLTSRIRDVLIRPMSGRRLRRPPEKYLRALLIEPRESSQHSRFSAFQTLWHALPQSYRDHRLETLMHPPA